MKQYSWFIIKFILGQVAVWILVHAIILHPLTEPITPSCERHRKICQLIWYIIKKRRNVEKPKKNVANIIITRSNIIITRCWQKLSLSCDRDSRSGSLSRCHDVIGTPMLVNRVKHYCCLLQSTPIVKTGSNIPTWQLDSIGIVGWWRVRVKTNAIITTRSSPK